MATEQGVVTKIETTGAWVKTVKSSACKGCTARGSCHSLGGGEDAEVKAINEIGARVGDRILLSFETASLLKATFLLYVFPILLLILGAVMGHQLALILDLNASALAAIVGFAFFFAAVGFIKAKANRLAQKVEYQPKIIKILARTEI